MKHAQRIVTALPLDSLWDDDGPLAAQRMGDLSAGQVQDLLGDGPLRLVFAEMGERIRWFPEAQCFILWKHEVQPHLAPPNAPRHAHVFPGSYCYVASLWTTPDGDPLLLFEKHL